MTELREHLARRLEKSVDAHGLVVWSDTEREYAGVWSSLVPEDVRAEGFDGSWYELRQRIDSLLGGDSPPRLVVYAPDRPPVEDPLEEIRRASKAFKLRLSTLVKQSLGQRLSPVKIDEIAKAARTLEQAEQAAEGAGDADVRLVGILDATDQIGMLAEVLTGTANERLDSRDAWAAVADLARHAVGAAVPGSSGGSQGVLFPPDERPERGEHRLETSDGVRPVAESRSVRRVVDEGRVELSDEVRVSLFQHLVLCDLALATGGQLPEWLAVIWTKPSVKQQKTARKVLKRFRETTGGHASYRRLAVEIDNRLGLDQVLEWWPGLEDASGTPAIEAAIFRHAIELMEGGGHTEVSEFSEHRLSGSPWTSHPASASHPASEWGSRWRVIKAVARLHAELSTVHPPDETESSRLLAWYAEQGWKVDRAHRRLELARTELGMFGGLEDVLISTRNAYEGWLEGLLLRFVAAVVDGVLDPGDLVRQGDVHDRFIGAAGGRTAYVWVDALRYELGVELADALRQITDRVEMHAAVAAAPTITQVGMANLLPGASAGLRVSLDGERLAVTIRGTAANTVADRCDLLRARHGSIADLDLNDASQKGEKALDAAVGDADLVLIRSQEVDAAGESGLLSVAWADFQNVVNLLAGVIARLSQCGINRVVVSADHGFIALSRGLGTDRTVDAPAGASGVKKRRVFIGRGGTPNQATARIPLAAFGIPGDLDLVVPKGLAVFKAGGSRQFFHGGISPQELVVPVIVAELQRTPPPQRLQVKVSVAGEKIFTGIFAASLSFDGDIFVPEVRVRVVAGRGSGAPVARIVSGDGYDPDTGAVTVAAGRHSVLTFQVIENLAFDTSVDLQVFDARTGRMLGSSTALVASPVVVEDSLD